MKRYELKCFCCGRSFKDKGEVYRDIFGWPLCQECMYDQLGEQLNIDDDYVDFLIEGELKKHSSSVRNYARWMDENLTLCEECNRYVHNEEFDEQYKMCGYCIEKTLDQVKENENYK